MKTRKDVALEDRWNVEALYPNIEAWQADFKNCKCSNSSPFWPELDKLQGTLNQSPENVKKALDLSIEIEQNISKLYTYAHLRHDEDIVENDTKQIHEQIVCIAHIFNQETSWMTPELLSLSDEKIAEYLSSPILADYRFHLEKTLRLKKYVLSPECEKLLALSGQALQTSYKAFNAISDADFKFEPVLDSQGELRPLSHGTYGLYMRDSDRTLRKNAFTQYHQKYGKYENTVCELLTGQIQNHWFQSQARGYSSCLEAALYPKNIPTSVYHALIEAVHDRLDVLHHYMDLRKKVLKLDELHFYDIHVPLIPNLDIRIPYSEAEDIIIESVNPLGKEYQDILYQGLKLDRWVDRYENQNKRSGAYSSGCFGSMPYILMNYKNILRDAFTLAHEAGHSMHSFYSRNSQPYHYSDYPIFLAEVASTFNEDLLMQLMVSRCKNPQEKMYLINQKIEDLRGTLFRQTQFAEFELALHELVEKGIPITPKLLKEKYRKLNGLYYGSALYIDPEIEIEWARIPHFYYNFYVYQYATGISAALSLSQKVVNGNDKDRDAYLSFLKGGSSQYPIDMLKMAGVDMTSPEPVITSIETFNKLLVEFEKLLATPY